jgi:hypothetical protein
MIDAVNILATTDPCVGFGLSDDRFRLDGRR